MSATVLRELNQRPIAYYPLYRNLTGSLQGAILLSQLMFWFSKHDKFYKTNKDFSDELQLSNHEIKSAKNQIKKLPFIKITREGIPAKTYYEIDWDTFELFVSSSVGQNSTNLIGESKNSNPDEEIKTSRVGQNSTNCRDEIQPTITYNTTYRVPKGTCPQSGHDNKSSSSDNLAKSKRKALNTGKKRVRREVRKETVELIDYWNQHKFLTTHGLNRRRTVAPLDEQSNTIQEINQAVYRLLQGKYYTQPDVPAGIKKKKFTVAEIKKIIDVASIAYSPDYYSGKYKPSFLSFLANMRVKKIGEGKDRFKFRYPFIHYLNNSPELLVDTPARKNTEYTILVERTLKKLAGTRKPTDKNYNQVVIQVEKAVDFLKKVSNGNFAENRMRLPDLLHASLIEEGLPLTVDSLPLGVYNLEKLMKKRLMI